MFATLLLVRLIRKSRQAEEAFRFNKSEFNTISCFKGSLRLMEIEGAFQYKKVDFLQVGAENDAYNPKISVSMLYWEGHILLL